MLASQAPWLPTQPYLAPRRSSQPVPGRVSLLAFPGGRGLAWAGGEGSCGVRGDRAPGTSLSLPVSSRSVGLVVRIHLQERVSRPGVVWMQPCQSPPSPGCSSTMLQCAPCCPNWPCLGRVCSLSFLHLVLGSKRAPSTHGTLREDPTNEHTQDASDALQATATHTGLCCAPLFLGRSPPGERHIHLAPCRSSPVATP